MVKGFEIVEVEKYGQWTDYYYKFKLNSDTFYSYYSVTEEKQWITIKFFYYRTVDCKRNGISFSKEFRNEIKKMVLERPEIRLRHLVSPYSII